MTTHNFLYIWHWTKKNHERKVKIDIFILFTNVNIKWYQVVIPHHLTSTQLELKTIACISLLCLPFEEDKDILLFIYWSVSPSVTFLFPINNSRMPWPTFLKLCTYICPGQQRNPFDYGVTGSKVKVTRVKCAKTF